MLMFKQYAVIGSIFLYMVSGRSNDHSEINLFGYKQIKAGASNEESLRNAFRGQSVKTLTNSLVHPNKKGNFINDMSIGYH